MGWITSLLGFLDKLFAFLNMQAAKKAGKDELKVEQNEALQEKKKIAADIDSTNPDDQWLLPPEKRGRGL
jgi:hypothetical protein